MVVPGNCSMRPTPILVLVVPTALLSIPVMISAGRRDPNPAALFVLLYFAVPPAAVGQTHGVPLDLIEHVAERP